MLERNLIQIFIKKMRLTDRIRPITTLFPLLAILTIALAGLSGCDSAKSPSAQQPTTPSPTTSTSPSAPSASPSPSPSPTGAMTTITIYKATSDCDRYTPESVEVPADQAIEAAVGQVIEAQNNVDFKLAGYRVNVADGVATVDVRVAPDSPRQVVSLSSCEQFALFGSINETLTKNPEWQIQTVEFTDRGEEIAF
jgi:hypothetical protein